MKRKKQQVLASILLAFGLFGSLAAFSSNALAQTYVFGRADFATGASPVAIVTGDFNGDGRLDLATANSGDTVSVLIGKPDGTFQTHVDYKVGTSPSAIATGDFNGDGKPDLAVANSGDGTVSILLGNGDGTYQVAGHYQVASAPASIAAGDFNKDGKLDLAVANSGSNSVSVLIGHGDGTFDAPVDFAVGSGPVSVAAGDFNGDGKLDLAVANGGDGTVSILLGNGNGTFGTAVSYGLGEYENGSVPSSMAMADLNGDGRLDLVVGLNESPTSSSLSVLLGNGDGSFTPASAVGFGTGYVLSVAVGDFNRDGKLDVVASPGPYGDASSVFLGNGDGSFQWSLTGCRCDYNYNAPSSLIVGDFNGDGGLDVAVTNEGSNTVSIVLGDFNGTFGEGGGGAGGSHYEGFGPMAVGDFNGDGKLDLVTAFVCPYIGCPDFGGDASTNGVTISLGNGDGTFQGEDYTVYSGSSALYNDVLEVGDFNADGKQDVAVALSDGVGDSWYLLAGNGDGTFQAPVSLSGPPSGTLFTPFVDFNGDGVPDQATVSGGTISILLGGSSQTLPGPSGNFGSPSAGDFNGDGAADLAVMYFSGDGGDSVLEVFLNLPAIAIFPNRLVFNAGSAGGTAAQSVTISNPGLALLKISSITITGDFAQTNNCGSTLASAATCTITVTSALTGAGTSTGSISITDNAPGSPHLISLSATGPSEPGVSVAPLSLSFASQQVATTSTKQSVTVTSSGNAPLTVTSVGVSGDFAQTNTCGGPIAAGATCTISVTFTPSASGIRTGTITINDNAPDSPQVVSLTGTGTAPAITLSASTLSVGTQAVRTTSAAHTLTLTNSGNGVLTISGITSSGDFAETNTCGSSVAAGASCTISVTFTPTAPGTRTGAITVSDNAPGSPHVVSLTGTGTGPAVSFSASTMSVGGQVVGTKSAAHKITLTDTGNAALSITGMTLSSASFSETNSCGTSLAAGASCTITLTFTPSTAGEITGMLSITDNASGSPHQVTLSGVGQDFTIGPYNLAHTMPAGFSASYDLDLAPEGGFNQDVSLACSGAPQQGTCTVTPASATLDGRNHAVVTLRVATGAPADVPPRADRPLRAPPRWPPALVGSVLLLLAALLLTGFGVTAGNRPAPGISSASPSPWRRPRLRVLTPICALLLLTLVWVACGGGGTFVASPPTGGTPSGDYVITVTATSGNLTHAVTVKLTVH